jgi:hypothetical protein
MRPCWRWALEWEASSTTWFVWRWYCTSYAVRHSGTNRMVVAASCLYASFSGTILRQWNFYKTGSSSNISAN